MTEISRRQGTYLIGNVKHCFLNSIIICGYDRLIWIRTIYCELINSCWYWNFGKLFMSPKASVRITCFRPNFCIDSILYEHFQRRNHCIWNLIKWISRKRAISVSFKFLFFYLFLFTKSFVRFGGDRSA